MITTIGLDHTAILGDTIEAIAEQKCGIIKRGSRAVTSAQDERAMQVIKSTCEQLGVPLRTSGEVALAVTEQRLNGSALRYHNREFFLPLSGAHQVENAKTALAALEYLNEFDLLPVSDEAIAAGFAKAVNPARLETLCEDPIVLLDGAHNPNGIEALKHAIGLFLPDTPIICVMGMLADKDIDSAIALLDGVFTRVHTVPVDNPRAISSAALAEKFRRHCPEVISFDSAEKGFDEAFALAKEQNAAVLICGSLYLAGEIRPYILNKI